MNIEFSELKIVQIDVFLMPIVLSFVLMIRQVCFVLFFALLSQPNLTVAVTKQCIGTHPSPPPQPHQHKLLTANISAISQPIELKFFLVTLQWVIAMSRLQKILSSSQELLQPALLVTANISAISQAIELQNFCCNLFQRQIRL